MKPSYLWQFEIEALPNKVGECLSDAPSDYCAWSYNEAGKKLSGVIQPKECQDKTTMGQFFNVAPVSLECINGDFMNKRISQLKAGGKIHEKGAVNSLHLSVTPGDADKFERRVAHKSKTNLNLEPTDEESGSEEDSSDSEIEVVKEKPIEAKISGIRKRAPVKADEKPKSAPSKPKAKPKSVKADSPVAAPAAKKPKSESPEPKKPVAKKEPTKKPNGKRARASSSEDETDTDDEPSKAEPKKKVSAKRPKFDTSFIRPITAEELTELLEKRMRGMAVNLVGLNDEICDVVANFKGKKAGQAGVLALSVGMVTKEGCEKLKWLLKDTSQLTLNMFSMNDGGWAELYDNLGAVNKLTLSNVSLCGDHLFNFVARAPQLMELVVINPCTADAQNLFRAASLNTAIRKLVFVTSIEDLVARCSHLHLNCPLIEVTYVVKKAEKSEVIVQNAHQY